MRLRRLAAARVLVLAAVGLLATACTSTTNGIGHAGRSPSRTSSGSSSTGSGTSQDPSTIGAPTNPPADFGRTPVDTSIGDPGTADLCSAVGADTFSGLGVGTTTADPVQYPPGCSFTLSNASGPVLTVSVFAARHQPPDSDGRTTRTASGLDVYSYPFDAQTGGCIRDVVAHNVRLVADAITRGSAAPEKQLSCAATDALANRLAEVAANGSVPRLSLAHPSVVDLSACSVVKVAGITALSAFASGDVLRRGFDVNCEVRTDALFLFINAAVAATAPPTPGTPVSVDGHDLYEIASHSGFCSYASVQGTTGNGKHEEVTAAATAPGNDKPPANLCAQTAQALALYLTAAGLS